MIRGKIEREKKREGERGYSSPPMRNAPRNFFLFKTQIEKFGGLPLEASGGVNASLYKK